MKKFTKSLKKGLIIGISTMALLSFAGCGENPHPMDTPAKTEVSWTEMLDGQEVTNKVD